MAELSKSDGPIIQVKDLAKQFGEQSIIHQLNLIIPRGLIFGFIGPSGCGKTTTIRLLTGVYKPSGGEVHVLGKIPSNFTPHDREKIGYMPQHFALYPDLTVWENLRFAASIYGVGSGRRARMRQLLQFIELDEHRRKPVRHISGGMQRRLVWRLPLCTGLSCYSWMSRPAGIDPVLRRKFWDYFKELRQGGTTIFVTTQYVSEANYCDLVGIMVEGNLLAVDTPAGLRRNAMGGEVVTLKIQEYFAAIHISMIDHLPFVQGKTVRAGENEVHIVVNEASTAIPALIEWCAEHHLTVNSIQTYTPPFDDVFVALIEKLAKEK